MIDFDEIIAIATHKTLTLEAKKQRIRAVFMEAMRAEPDKISLDKHKRFVLKLSLSNFATPEQYAAYMKRYGPWLINYLGSFQYTLLTRIAATDAYHLVSWLIRQGARPDLASRNGITPVHEACRSGQVKMLETLIIHGAKINPTITYPADDFCHGKIFEGQTPMHFAIRYGHIDCIELLLKQKSYRNLRHANFNISALEWAKIIKEHVIANTKDEDIVTTEFKLGTSALFGMYGYRDQKQIPTINTMDKIIEMLEQYEASCKENNSISIGQGIFTTKNACGVALFAAGSLAIKCAL